MTEQLPTEETRGSVFVPNSVAQRGMLECTAPEVLISSMYGRGKSRVLCEILDITCRTFAGASCVLARKKREDMGTTTLATLLDEVISPEHKDWGWRVSADGGSQLLYPNGSRIIVIGLDRSGKVKSGAYLKAAVDQAEELTEDEWKDLAQRLRQWSPQWRWYSHVDKCWKQPVQQMLGACNPDDPSHWLYSRFRLSDPKNHSVISDEPLTLPNGKVLPRGRVIRTVFYNERKDNVENLSDSYLERQARLTGIYAQRYEHGLWVKFEGLVYPNFEESVHVLDEPKPEWGWVNGYPPPSWKIYNGVDFGFTNPFVLQWWACSPLGVWVLFQEIYHSRRTVPAHAEMARDVDSRHVMRMNEWIKQENAKETDPRKKRDTWTRVRYAGRWADPADPEGIEQLNESLSGFIAGRNDLSPGIQHIYDMTTVRIDPVTNEGRALIYYMRNARVHPADHELVRHQLPTCTWEEKGVYKWPKDRKPATEKETVESPTDAMNHGCASERYCIFSASKQGGLEVTRIRPRAVDVEDD